MKPQLNKVWPLINRKYKWTKGKILLGTTTKHPEIGVTGDT